MILFNPALSYLCLINKTADDLRLKRIVNEPKRKIGETTVSAIEKVAAAEGCSMFEVMKNCRNYTALSQSYTKILDFVYLIEKLREIAENEPLDVLTEKTIDLSGYGKMLIDAGEAEKERLENVQQMISNAQEYANNNPDGNLASYLEEVSLVADIDNYDKDAAAVTLMLILDVSGFCAVALFCCAVHEAGHIICLLIMGEKPKLIELSFYGVRLERAVMSENAGAWEPLVYASGPAANFMLSALLFVFSNKFPGLHGAAVTSLGIGIFNLIPCRPLDGGNLLSVLMCRFLNEKTASLISGALKPKGGKNSDGDTHGNHRRCYACKKRKFHPHRCCGLSCISGYFRQK